MTDILEIAILELGRQRKKEPFLALEIIKWVYPQDWQRFIPDLLETLDKLQKEGKIVLLDEQGKSAREEPNEKTKILVKG
ncbi:hypothetical protein QWY93_16050 [Echinicola jeungdonensis]|uniref:DUF3253 domain-containing protein n=1 Tax=Echinicola jeungdonensis TaxID=709343 RepID=A0ABV5J7U0_9BACT|nr:hypothetical protein [Echinicola jeungdonensis]MDN3670834.1 hypothetical protein [Echinicola jeungdonensis]